MPQLLLPTLLPGETFINSLVRVLNDDIQWIYFFGEYPIYSHAASDQRMFRLTIAQLIESKVCRQKDIIDAFKISKSSVIRAQNKLRYEGPDAFFIDRRGRKGGNVLTPDKLNQAQELLDQGKSKKK